MPHWWQWTSWLMPWRAGHYRAGSGFWWPGKDRDLPDYEPSFGYWDAQ